MELDRLQPAGSYGLSGGGGSGQHVGEGGPSFVSRFDAQAAWSTHVPPNGSAARAIRSRKRELLRIRRLGRTSLVLAVATIQVAFLSACNDKSLNTSGGSGAGKVFMPHLSPDFRALRAGETIFYVPLSWLTCTGILPRKQLEAASNGSAPLIKPPFQNVEPADQIHDIVRNPGMVAGGLSLKLRYCFAGAGAYGIADRSAVYEIAFINRRLRLEQQDPAFLSSLRQATAHDGWIQTESGFYEVETLTTAKTAGDLTFVAGQNLGDRMMLLPFNDDILVQMRWEGPSTKVFDPKFATALRKSARSLAGWLTEDPNVRGQIEITLGEAR